MKNFNEVKEMHSETLRRFVPVVARVHGQAHPEFHQVHDIYNKINEKMLASKEDRPELDEEFKELRKVTDNYKVPEDTCESYEAVYNMLSDLDQAYSK